MPFPNIGPGELILILIIALVVLGPGKLPDVAQSLGRSLREFRRAASDVSDAAKVDAPAPAQAASPGPSAASAAPATPVTPAAPAAPAPTAAPVPNTLSTSSEPNTLHPAEAPSEPKLS